MLVISIFGLVFIIVGIVAMINNGKYKKIKPVKGVVTGCEKVDRGMASMDVEWFETEIEFTTSYGTLHRKIKDNQPFTVGTCVDVRFDAKGNKLYLERELRKKGNSYAIAMIVLGLIVAAIGAVLQVLEVNVGDVAGACFGLLASGIFMFVGAWLSFVVPNKRKKILKDSDIVEGELVDFVKAGRSNADDRHRRRVNYAAIFEYTYGGHTYRYRSSVSGNGSQNTEYGRKVSIAVNNNIGDVICIDDEKTGAFMGIILMVFAIGAAAVITKVFFL